MSTFPHSTHCTNTSYYKIIGNSVLLCPVLCVQWCAMWKSGHNVLLKARLWFVLCIIWGQKIQRCIRLDQSCTQRCRIGGSWSPKGPWLLPLLLSGQNRSFRDLWRAKFQFMGFHLQAALILPCLHSANACFEIALHSLLQIRDENGPLDTDDAKKLCFSPRQQVS